MINDILRELRKKMGYTQQEISEILGIERSTYTYYETGKTEIPVKKLELLARLYGISISDFLGNETMTLNDPGNEKEGKTEVGMLSKEEKQLLARIRLLGSTAKRVELYRFLDELGKDSADNEEQ